MIDQDGSLHTLRLGNNPTNGDTFQRTVRAGSWFAAHLDLESDAQHHQVQHYDWHSTEYEKNSPLTQYYADLLCTLCQYASY